MITWLPAAAVFAAALILQDCALLAAAGLLSARGFYWSMDRAAPLSPGSGAFRCLTAGLALLTVALVQSAIGIASLLDWWRPAVEISEMTPVFVIAAVALPSLVRSLNGFGGSSDLAVDVLALTAFIAVVMLRNSGFGAAACWALLASGGALVGIAWHLSRTVANAFFENAKA